MFTVTVWVRIRVRVQGFLFLLERLMRWVRGLAIPPGLSMYEQKLITRRGT